MSLLHLFTGRNAVVLTTTKERMKKGEERKYPCKPLLYRPALPYQPQACDNDNKYIKNVKAITFISSLRSLFTQ